MSGCGCDGADGCSNGCLTRARAIRAEVLVANLQREQEQWRQVAQEAQLKQRTAEQHAEMAAMALLGIFRFFTNTHTVAERGAAIVQARKVLVNMGKLEPKAPRE